LFDLSISGRSAIALTLLAGLIFLVYSAVLSPHSFGYYNDDAMYLSSAKSLATGHGYRQISLPFDIAQTKYPPLFPFILSLVWRLRPDFPANLTALMMVAVAGSIAAALLTWIYFTRCKYTSRWMGLLIVGLAAINGTTISLSVGVFSEMVYAMFAVIALLLAETYEEKEKAPILGILLGIAIGCAFLTRVTGITLLIAIGLYFLMRRKLRRAVVPLSVAFLFMLAWGLWTHHNRAGIVEPNAVFYTDYMRYSYDLVRDAHVASHEPMLVVAGEMGWKNLVQLLGYWVPSETLGSYMNWLTFPSTELQPVLLRCILLLGLFFIGLGMRTDRMPRWRLLPIYVLLYIGIHLTLPYHFNTFDRYLAPILPFAILCLIKGLQESVRLTRSWARSMSPPFSRFANGIAILIVFLLGGFALTSYSLGLSNTLKYRKDDVVQRSYQD
ncbi:MAG: ArnT family glycosyltransferase, partial [Blastocatellia bacterium]